MAHQNHYTSKFESKTNIQLEQIINNPSKYNPEAVQSAIWVLEERGENSQQLKEAQENIELDEKRIHQTLIGNIGISVPTQDWKYRLLHWIVDTFIIYLFAYMLALIPFINLGTLLSFVLFPIYYILFESMYGQTPGKMVTDSIVVNSNGEQPSQKSIILRTAARYIPFEGLSCLGVPSWGWHDRWTETYVIRKVDLENLVKARNNENQST